MKTTSVLLIIIIGVILTSCATSKYVQTGKEFAPYQGPIQVFYDEIPDTLEYSEIGLISSSGGTIHEWTHLIEAIQKKAASKGANAVLLLTQDSNQISTLTYNQYTGLMGTSGAQKSMTAVAIRLKE